MRSLLAAMVLIAVTTAAGAAQQISGQCIAVIDGDTLDVQTPDGVVRVRLAGIDAPEAQQPYGGAARSFLAGHVMGQPVEVTREQSAPDKYGRTLGRVVANGQDLNLLMVKEGQAWSSTEHASDPTLLEAEAAARVARRGLWADPTPLAPWKFRRYASRVRTLSELAALRRGDVSWADGDAGDPPTTAESGPAEPEGTVNQRQCSAVADVTRSWLDGFGMLHFAVRVKNLACCSSGTVGVKANFRDVAVTSFATDKVFVESWEGMSEGGSTEIDVDTRMLATSYAFLGATVDRVQCAN